MRETTGAFRKILLAGAAIVAGTAALAAAFAAALTAVPAAAQEARAVELGGFARRTSFDGDAALTNRVGAGLRAGWFVAPAVSLELAGAYTRTRPLGAAGPNEATVVPVHGRVLLHVPLLPRLYTLTGAGVGATLTDPGGGGGTSLDPDLSLLTGLRFHVVPRVALRLDGAIDWTPSALETGRDALTLGSTLGLSVVVGGRRPPSEAPAADADGDGVVNAADACPGTAPRSAVDPSGCPRRPDADGDGVPNLDDICPDTPPAVAVDAMGCARPARTPGEPAPS